MEWNLVFLMGLISPASVENYPHSDAADQCYLSGSGKVLAGMEFSGAEYIVPNEI
jgi:hypothetical protein